MIADKSGSVLPTICEMANSGRPVTWDATVTGIPIEPNATGAVFAMRQSYGCTKTGGTFQKSAKRKGDQKRLQSSVRCNGSHEMFNDFELTAFDGDIK